MSQIYAKFVAPARKKIFSILFCGFGFSPYLWVLNNKQTFKDMKELKTDLGIEYEIEIIKIYDDAVDIKAVCQEGEEYFFIDLGYKIKADQTTYAAFHDTGDLSILEEHHLIEINNWVNEITIGFIAKEIAMWCVRKSDDKFYWSFDIIRHRSLSVRLCKHDKDNSMKVMESHHLHGEDEIKDFLFYNK